MALQLYCCSFESLKWVVYAIMPMLHLQDLQCRVSEGIEEMTLHYQ